MVYSPNNGSTRTRVLACYLFVVFLSLGCGSGGVGSTTVPQQSPSPPLQEVITWIQQTTKPISSVDPTSSDSDLTFVDGLVGDAAILGLGEATHGSSEFQKIKHRVFRYMVEHKGVTAFGLEAQIGRCQAIDHYVLTGQGDPIQVIKDQGFWVWSTQEMLDLVNWMRDYNTNPAHVQKLRLFGIDMQDGGVEIDQVLAYLQPIDAQAAINLAKLYAPYRPYTWDGGFGAYLSAPLVVRNQCHANIQQAYQWMVDHQSAYSAATGSEAYAWALQMAKVVVQNEALNAVDANNGWGIYNIRDQAMADNTDWHIQQLGIGTKVVLSAHNGHINKKGIYSQWTNTGDWLSQRHGSGYLSIGFAFDSGKFNAVWQNANGTFGGLQSNTVSPARQGSYEATFAQAGLNMSILDMRSPDLTQPGPIWLNQTHDLREIGAVWNSTPGYAVGPTVLPIRFDVLIFINNVTATTLLK